MRFFVYLLALLSFGLHPKPSLSAEITTTASRISVIFLDGTQVLSQTSKALGLNGSELISLVNKRVKEFAESLQAEFVFQQAVYASPRVNLTSDFIAFVISEGKVLPKLRAPAVKVGFVNGNVLLQAAREGGAKDEVHALQTATNAAASLARSVGIDLVVQEAVWVNPSVDLTRKLVPVLAGKASALRPPQ